MKQVTFPVVIEGDSDAYEEALKNIRDAIQLHIEDRPADGEEIPSPRVVSLPTVEVSV